jgi:integrase
LRDATACASVNFASVKSLLCREMLHSFKLLMLWMVENRATGTVHSDFAVMRAFFRFVGAPRPGRISEITGTDLLNYQGSLPAFTHERTIGRLRSLLGKWHSMGLPGVAHDTVAFFKGVRIKGSIKGRAVRTHDPNMGPFTSIEFDGIVSQLDQRVAGRPTNSTYAVLAYLLIGLGIRPAQCALLKVGDITRESYDGRIRYILRVPQIKQRHRESRAEFRDRVLPPLLGKVVCDHAEQVRASFAGVFNDAASAPLLPTRHPNASLARAHEYHSSAGALTKGLQAEIAELKVYSERTGKPLNTPPIRFRRTFATRAAAAGWSAPAIAEALGHSNTKHVMVYIEAIPDIAARIDRAVATEMAPLAQAFAGTLIENEGEAIRGSDPASRIFDARIDRSGAPLGSCGQFSFCGLSAPLACYTCQHFQPWLDGPHAVVRDYLLDRRAQLLEAASEPIAQINDRRILAVEQVVQLCRQAKQSRGELCG